MKSKIKITNKSPEVVVIDIEGIIGVPEKSQFEDADRKVATYEKFCQTLDKLRAVTAPEVVVNIRSTGGNVNDALLIHEALTSLGSKITTRCFGYVASAATIIAQAASQGCREISSNSLYLIHSATCAAEGNARQIAHSLELLSKTDSKLAEVYAERSGRPVAQFEELMARNNGSGQWLSAEEALSLGLLDKIITPNRKESRAISNRQALNLPPIPLNLLENGDTRRRSGLAEWLGRLISEISLSDSTQVGIAPSAPTGSSESSTDEKILPPQEKCPEFTDETTDLCNLVSELEAQNARLSAKPTTTKPKEDPSAQHISTTPNQSAYNQDLRNFI